MDSWSSLCLCIILLARENVVLSSDKMFRSTLRNRDGRSFPYGAPSCILFQCPGREEKVLLKKKYLNENAYRQENMASYLFMLSLFFISDLLSRKTWPIPED